MKREPRRTNIERVIAAGIWEARAEDAEVADDIARLIAAQLQQGDGTTLHRFATTGAIDSYEALRDELIADYDRLPERRREWVDMLGTYAVHAGERGPVEGWADL